MHAGHDMGPDGLQRRFLLLPGLRSSRVHVFDTQPDPRSPRLHKTIEAAELAEKAGYSRPHTLHCGPDGVFLTCLGGAGRRRRTGWHRPARPHHVRRAARLGDRPRAAVPRLRRLVAPQPEHADLQRVGHPVDDRGRHRARAAARPEVRPPAALLGPRRPAGTSRRVDLGAEHQMVLEIRPSHDPDATWGFVGVVISTADLSASVWRWHREGDGLEGRQGDHDPGRAGGPGRPAAGAAAVRRGPAAGHRHRPVRRRPDALRVLLGHRRAQAVRRVRPGRSARGRVRAAGRDRPTYRPSRGAVANRSPAARRWSRSAATGVASSSPTRCTAPGTTSSTPTASAPGWRRSTRTPSPAG